MTPVRPTIALAMFEQLTSNANPLGFLRDMVNGPEPTSESEHLDFKCASVNGKSITDGDVKKTWSEALAGFATTGGGMLVWGIDARRPPGETVDRACELGLVNDPFGLKSRLQQLLPHATDPPETTW